VEIRISDSVLLSTLAAGRGRGPRGRGVEPAAETRNAGNSVLFSTFTIGTDVSERRAG